MTHVFNYLLSESTFAFEVSRGRMRVAPEDGNTFVCLILRVHIHAILKYNGDKTKYVLDNKRVPEKANYCEIAKSTIPQ